MSVFCRGISRPWPHPQSQALAPAETNHRSRLPSSHGSPALTASQLNLRFSMVEISLAILWYSLFLSYYCVPHPFLLFLSPVSHMHHITYFLASTAQLCDVSRMSLLQISTSLTITSFSFALCFHFGADTTFSTPPPTPATHRRTFFHSCKPVFYISPAVATQCKHYAHADTRALSIRGGL